MSTSQKKSNVTVMPVPDITLVSDSEDKEVVDLEAIARVATVKLEKDLVEAKVQNDRIMQKKQEWANQLAVVKKKKEDKEAAEAHRKVYKDAKKRGSVQPPVSFLACLLWQFRMLTWFPIWAGCSA